MDQYKLGDRIEVVEADINSDEGKAQLTKADIVVLHNAFEFFGDSAAVEKCWTTVREGVCRRGQRLLVVPSLEETLASTSRASSWREWVVEIPLAYPEATIEEGDDGSKEGLDEEEFSNIHLYVVK